MISVFKNLVDRCKDNIETALLYIRGTKEFAFAMEKNPEIASGLAWFQGTIDEHDEKLKKDKFGRSSRVIELQDAYVLQRDVGYVYSERKRLFQIGLDSRLATNYHAGLLQQVELKREEKVGLPG